VRASRAVDGKSVFGFENRGAETRLAVNAPAGLGATDIEPLDRAVSVCPVAALVVKHTGYQTPYGKRRFDEQPIGSDIEGKRV
jgi:[NiFe] hydrogenase diaphorase moiety small subunit